MEQRNLEYMNEGFRKIFQSSPDLYLLLSPEFKIIDASDAYLKATLTKRGEILGYGIFDIFPDNPDDSDADGVFNLQRSLNTVLQNKVANDMPIQKYDIARPDGIFESRFWKPLNSPVLDEQNNVIYIIHRVEDVTDQQLIKTEAEKQLREKQELEVAEKKYLEHIKESEARFFKIFNLIPVATHITDASNGLLLHVNKAFEDLFLMKSEDVIGKTVIELNITNEQNRKEIVDQIKRKGQHLSDYELELRTGNGEMKDMLMSVEVLQLDNKECFLVSMVDISRRKQIEEELYNTNHFLDNILENIPDMVFVKDAKDLRFLRFNKAGEEMLGVSSEELLGKNDYDFFPKEQADFFKAKDKAVLDSEKLLIIDEEPIQAKHGEIWLHTKKIPVIENGRPVYLIGISADITERKKQQDAIIHLNKELEAFTYSVSHDLRTPLRAVTGYSQILEEDYKNIIDDEGRRLLHIISHNAEKMGHLIDDLLKFSRLGKKELQKRDTNLLKLVEASIADITRATPQNAQIITDIAHNANVDENLMKLVMINLIGNAIKYSSKKVEPIIIIKSELKEHNIVFSVKDNGAGFDMRYVDKLFGVFQRLHSIEEFEGTGVGLAIVHRIITRHGGKVWAYGKVNEGATLFFSIPKN